jgi:hypothetical protein
LDTVGPLYLTPVLAVADSHIMASRLACLIRNHLNLNKVRTTYDPCDSTKPAYWAVLAGQRLSRQQVSVCRALAWGFLQGFEFVGE